MRRRWIKVLLWAAIGTCCALGQPNKTQQQNNSQQQNGNSGQQNIPPQLYPLDRIPHTRADAEAILKGIRTKPHYIWYKTVPSKSSAIPVIIEPLTCKDFYDEKLDQSEDGPGGDGDFAAGCRKAGAESLLAPSQPTQNRNPLKLGDGMVIAIYDGAYLFGRFQVSLLGMNVQSQAGSALNTDPLRPTVSSSGGTSPNAGGAPQQSLPRITTSEAPLTPVAPTPAPATCTGISVTAGDYQSGVLGRAFPEHLTVVATGPDGRPAAGIGVTFLAPSTGATGDISPPNPAVTDGTGTAEATLTAGGRAGSYNVAAMCADASGNEVPVMFDETNIPPSYQFYYLPWSGNPVLGDTTFTVIVTAQAPVITSLTVTTDPVGLPVTVGGAPYASTATVPVASGTFVQVAAASRGSLYGTKYVFAQWSDGWREDHQVAVGSTPTTLVAEYVPEGRTTPVTLGSNPAGNPGGASVSSDTCSDSLPGAPPVPLIQHVVLCAPGSTHFSAPDFNGGHAFQSWSDGTPCAPGGGTCVDTVTIGKDPVTLTANYDGAATVPLIVSTNPPGLLVSVNGIGSTSAIVAAPLPSQSVTLSTVSPQSFGGAQYTFSNWSDGNSSNGLMRQVTAPSDGTKPAAYTALFTAAAGSGPTEQSLTLLNTPYPQSHNLYRFNVATGMVYSGLKNPSFSRVEQVPAVTCPAGAPQPCVPTSALYSTVETPGSDQLYPVLFFMTYIWRLDAERKWRVKDMRPALDLGLSLSSPASDFFAGVSSEVLVRGLQVVGGWHWGKVNELAPSGANDPTNSATPATVQKLHPSWFAGLTFNITFIQQLFSAAKGGS